MTYKRKPLSPRICTHCGDPYQAVDRRRLYCDPSCKTLASNARRRAADTSPTPETASLAAPVPAEASVASLPFDLQTVGVVAVGSALGNLGLRVADKLWSSPPPAPRTPATPVTTVSLAPVREDPASWFPAAVLATPAASLPVEHPQWPTAQRCLQLDYFGRRFSYQPTLRCLFWECTPGQLLPLNQQAEFTRIFELAIPELALPGLSYAATPRRLSNANAEAPGAVWQMLSYPGSLPWSG